MKDIKFIYVDFCESNYDEIAINTTDKGCVHQAIAKEEFNENYDGHFHIRVPFNPETKRRMPKHMTLNYITNDGELSKIDTIITLDNRKEILQYIRDNDTRYK